MALPRMERWTSCIRWNLAIPGFLAKHPEIDLLITSNHRGRVVVPEGQTEEQARGDGEGGTEAGPRLLRALGGDGAAGVRRQHAEEEGEGAEHAQQQDGQGP